MMPPIATRRGEVGNGTSAHRRRFCTRCGTRVSRSANKCGYCRRYLPRWKHLAGIALVFIVLLIVLSRLMN